jgi:hypothetical protein
VGFAEVGCVFCCILCRCCCVQESLAAAMHLQWPALLLLLRCTWQASLAARLLLLLHRPGMLLCGCSSAAVVCSCRQSMWPMHQWPQAPHPVRSISKTDQQKHKNTVNCQLSGAQLNTSVAVPNTGRGHATAVMPFRSCCITLTFWGLYGMLHCATSFS